MNMSSLSVENLTVSYKRDRDKCILSNLSLELRQGEFVCLCGPNGCGKSTLLSVIAGVPEKDLIISKGTVLFNNQPMPKAAAQRAKILAYMQQNESSTWDFKVSDYVLQGRYAHSNGGFYTDNDRKIVQQIMNDLGIQDFAERTVHQLSGGEFQKVRIARALAQQPSFLLLDEPAGSLDFVYEPQLMQLLKNLAEKNNLGVLVTIHDINTAYNYAEKIMLLPPQKNILEGSADDIMTAENLKITFGVDFQCKQTKSFQLLQ